MNEGIGDLTVWAEYGGFAGLVAAVLFLGIWLLMKMHREERKEWYDNHKTERAEWRSDSYKQNEQVVTALKELTNVIRDGKT